MPKIDADDLDLGNTGFDLDLLDTSHPNKRTPLMDPDMSAPAETGSEETTLIPEQKLKETDKVILPDDVFSSPLKPGSSSPENLLDLDLNPEPAAESNTDQVPEPEPITSIHPTERIIPSGKKSSEEIPEAVQESTSEELAAKYEGELESFRARIEAAETHAECMEILKDLNHEDNSLYKRLRRDKKSGKLTNGQYESLDRIYYEISFSHFRKNQFARYLDGIKKIRTEASATSLTKRDLLAIRNELDRLSQDTENDTLIKEEKKNAERLKAEISALLSVVQGRIDAVDTLGNTAVAAEPEPITPIHPTTRFIPSEKTPNTDAAFERVIRGEKQRKLERLQKEIETEEAELLEIEKELAKIRALKNIIK